MSTIKAPSQNILDFAAYHLNLGADHLYLFLDEDRPEARNILNQHDKVTVIVTDDAYWEKRGRRPIKHQVRQTVNATRTYRRLAKVDWLAHIDVDEFLWPQDDLRHILKTTPAHINSLRIRAIEAMAPHPDMPTPGNAIWYKGCAADRLTRIQETDQIFPQYGQHLNGGFLSHVEGKIFARTGFKDAGLRIHNLFLDSAPDKTSLDSPTLRLCHHHAPTEQVWLDKLPYRFDKGAYRADIQPVQRPDGAGQTIHEFLGTLMDKGGEDALHQFYATVCTATPDLCARLDSMGHLHCHDLRLTEIRKMIFPEFDTN